jgi:hypothetical protein
MSLAPERVREHVAEESDRRELNSLRCNSIPVQHTRLVIADALARDPELTIGEIAHWLDMRQADFERAYLGKAKGGRPKRRVNIANASRLMIALGRAPKELEGADARALEPIPLLFRPWVACASWSRTAEMPSRSAAVPSRSTRARGAPDPGARVWGGSDHATCRTATPPSVGRTAIPPMKTERPVSERRRPLTGAAETRGPSLGTGAAGTAGEAAPPAQSQSMLALVRGLLLGLTVTDQIPLEVPVSRASPSAV